MAGNGKSGENRLKYSGSPRFLMCIRLMGAAYWSLLTVVLLVPDPLALFGIEPVAGPSGSGVHFLLFALLGTLVLASRLPLPDILMALILVTYAVITELLQSFVPPRTVEARDFTENLLGLGVVYIIRWGFRKWSATGRGA